MSIARYVNSLVQTSPIMIGSKVPEQVGTLSSVYEVREFRDLSQTYDPSAPSAPIKARRGYIVTLQQKFSLANDSANSFSALNQITSYSGYPVLLVQQVTPDTDVDGLTIQVDDYHPRTLNTSVSVSANQSTTAGSATSVQHSSGSSTSVTNSYEISDSVGFFGADLTGSVSASVGQSTTNTVDRSVSQGTSQSRDHQNGSASAMTIKDWSSYAFLDGAKQQLSWVWGQEYPWNVIDFRSLDPASTDGLIELPGYVAERLYDGATVYPPSELAQFGLDFVGSARWLILLEGDAAPVDETISFAHAFTYWRGSHSVSDAALQPLLSVVANDQSIDAVTLNLPLLALDPIVTAGYRNGAVLGFVRTEFLTPPGPDGAPFRVKGGANTLYALGSGFDAPATEDTVLSASAVTDTSPARMVVYFKVTDEMLELSLHIKHWKLSTADCVLTFAINEPDPDNPVSPITRHVDALEAGSGADNITTITLRNRDYTSNDFYDYLVTGLNTVVITVAPANGQANCGYALRAVAVS